MPKDEQPVFVLKRRYDDFDQFTDEVQAWSLDFKQLDRGAFRGAVTQLLGPGFQLARARFRRRLHQVGQSPLGLKTFVVPMNPDLKLFWRGKYLEGNDLMAFPLNGELDAVSESNFDVCTVSLSVSLLNETAGRMGGAAAQAALLGPEVRRCDPKAMQQLRRKLMEIQRSLESTQAVRRNLSSVSTELVRRIAEIWLGGADHGWKRTAHSRALVIRAALDEIHGEAAQPLTVSELCSRTHVSERTLEYAFQERFGVSPKRYLLTHRFNSVRRALRSSDPRTTKVADVANQWGFWHMGQFAADYRRLFSELPSETLRAT